MPMLLIFGVCLVVHIQYSIYTEERGRKTDNASTARLDVLVVDFPVPVSELN